ncbi:hypothetical protein [Halomonas cerina]|uniref:Uncharacterized protein n=1 Tax=Halomonas cerina TaxID=447424 RepID=A0A839VI60_9GAMM|nr:hypothetical protein [Halomonas cerina]MBB3192076.1 hypothetical protein [Halomonas cerina]
MHTTLSTQARVYLHPAAATSPQAVRDIEVATGRLAFTDPTTRTIRLMPLVAPVHCLAQPGGAA